MKPRYNRKERVVKEKHESENIIGQTHIIVRDQIERRKTERKRH